MSFPTNFNNYLLKNVLWGVAVYRLVRFRHIRSSPSQSYKYDSTCVYNNILCAKCRTYFFHPVAPPVLDNANDINDVLEET